MSTETWHHPRVTVPPVKLVPRGYGYMEAAGSTTGPQNPTLLMTQPLDDGFRSRSSLVKVIILEWMDGSEKQPFKNIK